MDELGHKRVVHYSAGKSSLKTQKDRIPRRTTYSSSSPPPSSRYIENIPDTNLVPPPRYTSPLASLKLIESLQPKPATPLYRNAEESNNGYNGLPVPSLQLSQKLIERLQPKPATPQYRNAEESMQKMAIATANNNGYNGLQKRLQPKPVTPLYRNAEESMQKMSIATPNSNAYNGLPVPPLQSRDDETTRSMLDYYWASNVLRSGHAKSLDFERKVKKPEVQAYNPKVEDEYYDTAPAFIDIGRLSYNIGSDSNKASMKQ